MEETMCQIFPAIRRFFELNFRSVDVQFHGGKSRFLATWLVLRSISNLKYSTEILLLGDIERFRRGLGENKNHVSPDKNLMWQYDSNL